MHDAVGEFLVSSYTTPETVHDPSRKLALVLVENRPSFWLKYVVSNALKFNPDANLYLWGNTGVFEILDKEVRGTYVKQNLPMGFRTASDFSQLLLSPTFWKTFQESHVLIFQLDCVFVRPLRPEHFAWDYIGAVCGSVHDPVYNGGLSLRKRDAMLLAIELMDPDVLALAEDIAFSRTMRAYPTLFALPPLEQACEFALESFGDIRRVVGAHGTDKAYCPRGVLKSLVASAQQNQND